MNNLVAARKHQKNPENEDFSHQFKFWFQVNSNESIFPHNFQTLHKIYDALSISSQHVFFVHFGKKGPIFTFEMVKNK